MTPVRLLPEAEVELEAAASRYEGWQPGLGLALVREVRKACSLVSERPLGSRVVHGEIRRKIVSRFPYAILYRVEQDEIIVVAVSHRRRRPGYWRDRI